MRAIAGLGSEASSVAPRLRADLANDAKPLSERLMAAHALRCVASSGQEAVHDICNTLEDANRWLRIGLLRELAKMCPKYSAKKAASINEWPRWESHWVHRLTGNPGSNLATRILPTFADGLNDPDHDVKRNAMIGLALFGTLPPEAANQVEKASGLCERLRADVLKRGGRRMGASATCNCDLDMYEPDIDLDTYADRCERVWSTGGTHLDATLPKWIFLKYLAERHGLMLHGSRVADIDILRPLNKSGGSSRTADQPGVFAVDHASMAMYFGIIDRSNGRDRDLMLSL